MSRTKKGLQTAIQGLSNFCDAWDLKVNLEKTKVVVFGANVRKEQAEAQTDPFVYQNEEISMEEYYQYLGLRLQANCKMGPAVGELLLKGKRAVFALRQRCKELGIRNPYLELELMDALVVPIWNYGCEVWEVGRSSNVDWDTDDFERAHRAFLREMLRLRKSTPSMAILGEVGRWPLLLSRWKRVVGFYRHLCDREDNDISRLALMESMSEWKEGRKSWFYYLQKGVQ